MVETYHSDVIGCLICDLQEASQRLNNGTSWICTIETSYWRTTDTTLCVSFETCFRRCRDVLMGRYCYLLLTPSHDVPVWRREDVPLRRLGDVPPRRRVGCTGRRPNNVTATSCCCEGCFIKKIESARD